MAKAKRKKQGNAPRRGLQRWEMVVIGGFALLVAWGGWSWWQGAADEAGFMELATSGADTLSSVKQGANAGGGHLAPGESIGYGDRFPTSGRHDPKWLNPGVYASPQPATRLVHSLEHGMVVIYVDTPPDDVMATLESWAGLYGGPWSGVLVVPGPGLGKNTVLLTAWNKTLRLQPFDPAAAASFIDNYRGRGPEHPVR